MMKKLIIMGTIALALLVTSIAWANIINYDITISDLTEGSPVVTVGSGLSNVTITLANESAIITGTAPLTGASVNLETRMWSSSNEGPPAIYDTSFHLWVSDVLLFQSVGNNFTVTFKSDGADGFADAFYAGINSDFSGKPDWLIGNVYEPGKQWLGTIFTTDNININLYAQSDVDVAPIPGAVVLLGSGLGCLALYSRRKMTAKN